MKPKGYNLGLAQTEKWAQETQNAIVGPRKSDHVTAQRTHVDKTTQVENETTIKDDDVADFVRSKIGYPLKQDKRGKTVAFPSTRSSLALSLSCLSFPPTKNKKNSETN